MHVGAAVHGGCYLPRPLPLASVGSLSARLDGGASARDLGGAEALAFCQKLASAGLVMVQPVTAMKAAE